MVPPGPYERRRVKILGGMRPYKGRCAECKSGVRREAESGGSGDAPGMHNAMQNAYAKGKSREFGFRKGKRENNLLAGEMV